MKRLLPLAALLLAIPTMTSCTPHTTEATEVGVRFNKITKTMELAQPGATYFFVPFLNEWRTFDVATQNLTMVAQVGDGDRQVKDDLRFKTRDGNDIETDVLRADLPAHSTAQHPPKLLPYSGTLRASLPAGAARGGASRYCIFSELLIQGVP